ncbi:MAG: MFS transporter [Dehalococcoidia bacterium]|nr:MFS transporter [Dehalococcoidia bacterium]
MTSQQGEGQARSISRETILSLYLPAAVLALGTGIAAPVIPFYAKSFDISLETAGLVVILHALGQLASVVPTGYLIDKIGRRPVILAGPLLTALTAFLTAFSGSFEELLVWRFVNGFAEVMWGQARLAMIADTGGNRERGKLITWMLSLQRVGNLFAPAMGGFLATINMQVPFLVQGVLILIVLVPSFKLIKETRPVKTAQSAEEARGEWQFVFSQVRQPHIMYFLAAQFMASLTRGSTAGIIQIYMVFAYGIGPGTLGFLSSLNSVLVLPIGFLTGVIMDRYGRKMTLVPGFAGIGVTAMFMAFTAAADASLAVFLAAYFGLHMAQAVTAGNMQVLGSDLAPERARGRFFSVWRMFGEAGSAVSPGIFTGLAAAISYAAAFGFIGVSGATVALIIGFKIKETVGRISGGRSRRGGRRGPEPPAGPEPGPPAEAAAAEGGSVTATGPAG